MTISDPTRPATVATGHLALGTELQDRIREDLLTRLDRARRRLEQDELDGEGRADAPAVMEAIGAIEAALAKLDAGRYGTCETCAGPIPFERLEALPETQSCVACQARPRPLHG